MESSSSKQDQEFPMEAWEKHSFVRSALKKRGVQLDDVCSLCGLTNETIDHLFMQCPSSKAYLVLMPSLGLHVPRGTSIIDWLFKWIECKEEEGSQAFCTTMWMFWQERNWPGGLQAT